MWKIPVYVSSGTLMLFYAFRGYAVPAIILFLHTFVLAMTNYAYINVQVLDWGTRKKHSQKILISRSGSPEIRFSLFIKGCKQVFGHADTRRRLQRKNPAVELLQLVVPQVCQRPCGVFQSLSWGRSWMGNTAMCRHCVLEYIYAQTFYCFLKYCGFSVCKKVRVKIVEKQNLTTTAINSNGVHN